MKNSILKMKNYLLIASTFAFIFSSCSKDEVITEDEITGDNTETDSTITMVNKPKGDIYIVGAKDLNLDKKAIYFKNNTSIKLPNPDISGKAMAIDISGDDVHVLGNTQGDTQYNLTHWVNNVSQILLEPVSDRFRLAPIDIKIQGDDVHIVANEVENVFFPSILYWKNGAMTRITDSTKVGIAKDMFVDGDDVYIVGSEEPRPKGFLEDDDGIDKSATYWKNGIAIHLTDGATTSAQARKIVKENDDIYISIVESASRPDGNYDNSYIIKNGTTVKTFPKRQELLDFVLEEDTIHAITRDFISGEFGFESFLLYHKGDEVKSISNLTINPQIIIKNGDTYISGSYFDEEDNLRSKVFKNDEEIILSVDGDSKNVEVFEMIIN